MVIHKRTKLTPVQREELAGLRAGGWRACDLARRFGVSRPTVYKVVARGRLNDYSVHRSVNRRFRCLEYGLRRLSKVERELEERLRRRSRRYCKSYPGEMLHFDTKRLPPLAGEPATVGREYLFVAVDDFSRELYAAILPDRSARSAERFLRQVLDECPYTAEVAYSDNGAEYRGNPKSHPFMLLCASAGVGQRFTQPRHPYTNGKAERVVRTLAEMWHGRTEFRSRAHRRTELTRFVNWYNTVKPHKGIGGLTPLEKLTEYFYPSEP